MGSMEPADLNGAAGFTYHRRTFSVVYLTKLAAFSGGQKAAIGYKSSISFVAMLNLPRHSACTPGDDFPRPDLFQGVSNAETRTNRDSITG